MTDNLAQENADLRAQLIAALESCRCPYQMLQLDGSTIGECIRRGTCSCDNGDLIKISQRIAS